MSSRSSRDIIAFLTIFILFGLPSLGIFIFLLTQSPSSQMHNLRTNEKELMTISKSYVDSFLSTNHRLPTQNEFSEWAIAQSSDQIRLEGLGFSLQTAGYPSDLIHVFGSPPQNGYAINFWSGDAWVSYISWSADHSLAYVPDSEYFPFGSKIISSFIFLAVPCAILLAWVFATRNSFQKCQA